MGAVLPSVVALAPLLGLAALVALLRPLTDEPDRRRPAAVALLAGAAVHALHALEEQATGFAVRFPGTFDRPPMPEALLVAFNLGWIVVWLASARGLVRGVRAALVPAWFFAFAAVANGVAHPLLAARTGGYFPGLVTAPVEAAAGIWLWLRLARATRSS